MIDRVKILVMILFCECRKRQVIKFEKFIQISIFAEYCWRTVDDVILVCYS